MKKSLSNILKKWCFFYAILLVAIQWSCSSDDNNQPEVDDEPTFSELQQETFDKLTDNGNPTVWKITSAKLTSGTELLDISKNFNILDDEFIFSGGTTNGALEWHRGHDVNISANTVHETMLDYYRSPKESSVSFVGESNSDLVSDDFDVKVLEDGTISATFSESAAAKNGNITGKGGVGNLTLTLGKKNPDDYKAPMTNLQFTEAFTFGSTSIEGYSPGMIGSYSDNSLFLVNREDALSEGWGPERVIKFNVDDATQEESVFTDENHLDAVSKQLHVVNNKLIAFGGTYVNTYDLDLSSDPTSVAHSYVSEEFGTDISFSRFGIAVQDNAVYVIGGALTVFNGEGKFDIEEAKNIYKWDLETLTPTLFSKLPERRYGARATIINNKMYVFGGSKGFYDNSPTNTIYIIDMDDPGNIETLAMDKALSFSFVQKYENLIYVAGTILKFDADQNPTGRESIIGVFDTQNNSFTQITNNLTNPDGFHSIHQMAIFNGKMYVLYGGLKGEEIPNSIYDKWTIYQANIE